MKKLIPLLILIIAATLFLGCEMDEEDTYSVQERMEAFIDDVNDEAWGDLKDHTYSEATQHDEANAVFWENRLDTYIPLKDLAFTAEQVATCTDNAGTFTFTFYLTADSDDNNTIQRIERDATTIFY